MYLLFVGTYTGGDNSDSPITGSKGIYSFRMDEKTESLLENGVYGNHEVDPGFLAAKGKLLFAENERKDIGIIRSFIINSNGSLTFADEIGAKGSKCAHVCLDKEENYVVGAVYASGNVLVAKYNSEGKLSLKDNVFHHGRSIIPNRQKGAHAHSASFSPDGKEIFVPDLGMDKIVNYKFDRENGKLCLNELQPYIGTDAGEGPRHIRFHPNNKFAYLLTEIGNNIYVYSYLTETRTLKQIQKVHVLPKDFQGTSYAAELIISSDGQNLYSSNRGHDTISAFHIDDKTGILLLIGHYHSGGCGPRHICFGVDEKYIVSANKDSNNVCQIKRNVKTGELLNVVDDVFVPSPACILMTETE